MTTTQPPEQLRETVFARWTDPDARPLFKGRLIDKDGCCCAQGDVLRVCGVTDEDIRNTDQDKADHQVADWFNWPVWRAILLRHVNDSANGCPEAVLLLEYTKYARVVFGPQGEHVFRLLTCAQSLSQAEATRLCAAWDASGNIAWRKALEAAGKVPRKATLDLAWDAPQNMAWDASQRNTSRGAPLDASWWTMAGGAAAALVARDLIGQHGFTQRHYDTLTRPWRRVIGRIHPDDEDMKGGDK